MTMQQVCLSPRQCTRTVFPLPLRCFHCLYGVFTAFAAVRRLPLHCVFTAFAAAMTPPSPCVCSHRLQAMGTSALWLLSSNALIWVPASSTLFP